MKSDKTLEEYLQFSKSYPDITISYSTFKIIFEITKFEIDLLKHRNMLLRKSVNSLVAMNRSISTKHEICDDE